MRFTGRLHGAFKRGPVTRVLCQFSLGFLLASQLMVGIQAQEMDEYRVKAAFVYNFAKFVSWPPEAFRDTSEPFSICVLGRDPFGQALDDVVAGKLIQGHPVEVHRISDVHQTGGCRVLFVSSSERKRIVASLADAKAVLTIGEAGNSSSEGLIINFRRQGAKVRFEIDTAAADRAGVRISSKLLSLAQNGKR